MESKDLRIGNYLQSSRGNYFEVTSSDILRISEYESKAKPIELTEEILLKCGFYKRQTADIYPTFCLGIINVNDNIVHVSGLGFFQSH